MKLAAAVLAILVPLAALPLQAEAQTRLDPPYQLDPGESPPTTSPPTTSLPPSSGTFPANNPGAWGHLHPDCPPPATIAATTCPASVSAGGTMQNCTRSGGITLNGSNIAISCVNASVSSIVGLTCSTTNCQNIIIRRSTFTGAGPNARTKWFNFSGNFGAGGYSTSGSASHSVRIEKSVIQRVNNAILLGGGKFDKDRAAIEPGYAFVARENIFRDLQWDSDAHAEHVSMVETTDGALFENNVFDCNSTFNGSNPCNTAHILGQPTNGAQIQNITIRGNRFIGDKGSPNGFEFTIDDNVNTPGNCIAPIQFLDNAIEQFTTAGVFNYGGCPSIQNRTGSSCSGNTVNGTARGC